MTKQSVNAKQEAVSIVDDKPIEVDPEKLVLHNETDMCWRTWMCHLPEGADKSDLQTPSIWKRVQANRNKSLGVKDVVYVFSHDESWFAECRVYRADRAGVHLRFSKVQEFRETTADLWSDEFHELKFENGFFYVYDKRSGARKFSQGFYNEEQARTATIASYPTRAA